MEDNIVAKLLEKEIENVFSQLYFKNISIRLESGSKQGDGFMGLLTRALVSGEKNGINVEIDIMIKCAPKDKKIRKYMCTTPLFNRELFYYSILVPIYENIQTIMKVAKDMKYVFPKCIVTNKEYCEEYLMLENLKSRKFEMCRTNVLDYEHCKLAFVALGKLHALSYIFKESDRLFFDEISSQLGDTYFTSQNDYDCSVLFQYCKKALKKCLICLENEVHKKLIMKAMGDNVATVLKTMYETGNKKVICHGDYWINNMLFKYEDLKPVEVTPFDFQNCRYMSFANDFFHLYAFSPSTNVRRKHFWDLIGEYYESLSKYIAACGFNVNKFCTCEELEAEVREQALFGLALSIVILPFMTSNEPWQLHEVYAGNDPKDFYEINEEYRTRIVDMVTDYINFGFLK